MVMLNVICLFYTFRTKLSIITAKLALSLPRSVLSVHGVVIKGLVEIMLLVSTAEVGISGKSHFIFFAGWSHNKHQELEVV